MFKKRSGIIILSKKKVEVVWGFLPIVILLYTINSITYIIIILGS